MRYVVPVFSFLFSLFGVSFIVGLAMVMIFPPKQSDVVVGIGLEWWNLPGTLLGIWAGIHAWKASIRSAQKKAEKKAAKLAEEKAKRSSTAYPL